MTDYEKYDAKAWVRSHFHPARKMSDFSQESNQELFEQLRLLVIQYGTQDDVSALHALRKRFNGLVGVRDED
jgi:hypothetical protein